jgi:NodT family efflux transporter outer membrane factor (OMF) lipoprotein
LKIRLAPIVLASALPAACGCKLGPNYRRPEVPAPAKLSAEPVSQAAEEARVRITSDPPWEKWWEVFGDPEINRLVGEALAGNQDLRAALARVEVARGLARQVLAPLFPAVGASGDYAYQKISRNSIRFAGGSTSGVAGVGGAAFTGEPFDFYSGTADMSYELDVWGRLRRGLEAARGEEAVVEEDRRSAEITVIAETVDGYFDLGRADAELQIARETVLLRERTLDLVQTRVNAGLAPDLELRRAEGALASARALVPEGERSRAVAEHRLAVLLGRPPGVSFSGKPPAAFAIPPEVPVGIPSDLLERRPDVRAAERRLAAASARIGEALADFFPRFTIAGRFGYASLDLGTVANGSSQLWSLGPSVRVPIFEGGVRRARLFETEARRDENLALYAQTVLQAFREVADAISGIAAHVRIRERQREAVAASEQAVVLANALYAQGLTNFLDVLDSQRALLVSRLALLYAERQLLSSLVQLQKALGGGWSDPPGAPPRPGGSAPGGSSS